MFDDSLIDKEKTKLNYKRAAEIAMERNFVVSLQQHLFIGLE